MNSICIFFYQHFTLTGYLGKLSTEAIQVIFEELRKKGNKTY